MADPAVFNLELDDEERQLLRGGLLEWGGPAACTPAMAVAMGFSDLASFQDERRRLAADIEADQPLTAWDWFRVILATEVVFASDILGAGVDWSTTTGMSDEKSIAALRRVQRKLGVVGLDGRTALDQLRSIRA